MYGASDIANQVITGSILGNFYPNQIQPFACFNILENVGICITSLLTLSNTSFPLLITYITATVSVIIYLLCFQIRGLK